MKSITTLHFRKTIIQLFICILFLTGMNATAQNIYSVLIESWTDNNDWRNETQTLNTYDGSDYLINALSQAWVFPSGVWENSFQMNYTNNLDGTVNQSVEQSWDSGSSIWNNVHRSIYTYNATKKVLTHTSQLWFGDWLNNSKSTYTYDGSGYVINNLNQNWDFISSTWKNTFQTNFNNNANGTVNQSTTQSWNASNVWVDNHRSSFTYTADNKVLVETEEVWTGTNWVNSAKIINTYDLMGYLTNSLMQAYFFGFWVNDSQSIYTNNAGGNPLQVITQLWDSNTNTWNNETRMTFNYTLGTAEFAQKNDFVVYPNPSTGLITIKYNNSFNSGYSITDQTGRVIQKGSLYSETTSLDINGLSKGVYFLSVDKNYLKFIKN